MFLDHQTSTSTNDLEGRVSFCRRVPPPIARLPPTRVVDTMPHIRCYPRPGNVKADPEPHDYGTHSTNYSARLRELCNRYASPEPAHKGACKCTTEPVRFKVQLCFAKYIAGAWQRICVRCGRRRFVEQPGPKEFQLEEIEAQRDEDAVREQMDADERLALRLEKQERAALKKEEAANEKARKKQAKAEAALAAKQQKAEAALAAKQQKAEAALAAKQQKADAKAKKKKEKADADARAKTNEPHVKRRKKKGVQAAAKAVLDQGNRLVDRLLEAVPSMSKDNTSTAKGNKSQGAGAGKAALEDSGNRLMGGVRSPSLQHAAAKEREVSIPTEGKNRVVVGDDDDSAQDSDSVYGSLTADDASAEALPSSYDIVNGYEPGFVNLIFWIKDREAPLQIPVKVFDQALFYACYLSDYPEVRQHATDAAFPILYWDEAMTGWQRQLSPNDVIEVPLWSRAVFIRLSTVKICEGFPQALRRLQFDHEAHEMDEEFAHDSLNAAEAVLQREHSDEFVWVVFWWTTEHLPHAWKAAVSSWRNREVDLRMADFEEPSILHAHPEIEVWMPKQCQWTLHKTEKPLRLGATTHTILVRCGTWACMPGLGVELSMLGEPTGPAPIPPPLRGRSASVALVEPPAASTSRHQKRARSESVEILDPDDPATQAIEIIALAKKRRRTLQREGQQGS
ncbi:hypothetical protein OH77DRAFT_1519756 [Trametes cingulata]|nr:hypothetical protein OH77DRAFT_1519756 [Trametes cingulata]